MTKERQIDIGMTLDEKILDYLERQDESRLTKEIAEAIDEPIKDVTKRCLALYWDQKNKMKRVVVAPSTILYSRHVVENNE